MKSRQEKKQEIMEKDDDRKEKNTWVLSMVDEANSRGKGSKTFNH